MSAHQFWTVRDTKVRDFSDADEVRSIYRPEMEALIKAECSAARVEVLDHTPYRPR